VQREWSGGIFVGVVTTVLAHAFYLHPALSGVLGWACDRWMKNRTNLAKNWAPGARIFIHPAIAFGLGMGCWEPSGDDLSYLRNNDNHLNQYDEIIYCFLFYFGHAIAYSTWLQFSVLLYGAFALSTSISFTHPPVCPSE
jgi:hypothetical protein